jgi:probable selenium-dependent hydroxylase accessory protein YqeC
MSERNQFQTRSLAESLGLRSADVVSLAGAGGKTTLMFRLAGELILKGKKVVTTTTTRILEPTSTETPCFFVHADGERIKEFLRSHLDKYRHITVASERLGVGKVKGISPDLIVDLWGLSLCDYIIVEADGAAGRPVKAPRKQEPVIPSNTTLVVGLLGIDGAETELNEENAFQPERISQLTGIPLGGRISVDGLATLMTHPEGIFKGTLPSSRVVAFLNKVDIPQGMIRAERVAEKILEKRMPQIERVVLGSLKKDPPVVRVVSMAEGNASEGMRRWL